MNGEAELAARLLSRWSSEAKVPVPISAIALVLAVTEAVDDQSPEERMAIAAVRGRLEAMR